jgi:hypothetical protein
VIFNQYPDGSVQPTLEMEEQFYRNVNEVIRRADSMVEFLELVSELAFFENDFEILAKTV